MDLPHVCVILRPLLLGSGEQSSMPHSPPRHPLPCPPPASTGARHLIPPSAILPAPSSFPPLTTPSRPLPSSLLPRSARSAPSTSLILPLAVPRSTSRRRSFTVLSLLHAPSQLTLPLILLFTVTNLRSRILYVSPSLPPSRTGSALALRRRLRARALETPERFRCGLDLLSLG